MPSSFGPQDNEVLVKFGGGLHTRPAEDEVIDRECVSGQNFDLDIEKLELTNRAPFDLVGTTPNAGSIQGFITLQQSDGTVKFAVQSGTKVYEWDGDATFTDLGVTVDATAQLRGRLEYNWQLEDKVIITDLNLKENVMEWDGTTLQDVSFTKDDPAVAFGDFRAKYLVIQNERALYGNVYENGTNTKHLIVGSSRADYKHISVSDRPSSSLSDSDPFFLIQPDYRPINGLVEAYDTVVISSNYGNLFKLNGTSAKDFSMQPFYPRSGASGDESLVYAGNDFYYGRQGRIESVLSTERFGDIQTDDLSIGIQDQTESYKEWTSVFNSRTQKAYFFPDSESLCWVFNKPMYERLKFIEQGTQASTNQGAGLSPWVKYVTTHSTGFQPTAIMNMLDPVDGLEYIFFGDANGNIYRMEGTGSQDGGSEDVKTEFISKLYKAPLDAEAYNIEGYIKYRGGEAFTAEIQLDFDGEAVSSNIVTLDFAEETTLANYGDSSRVYSGSVYYGLKKEGRLIRRLFGIAGQGTEFQIRVTVTGSTSFNINEILLRFEEASS
jgi:hypothetical protein